MSRFAIAVTAMLVLTGCSAATYQNSQIGVIRSMLSLAGSHEADPNALANEVLTVDTLAVSPQRAWPELLRAWTALRIPVNGADEANFRIGGSTLPLGQLGGSKPSTWLDCGHGMTELYADIYQVTFSMATRIMPLDEGSTVETIVRATARPRDVSTEGFKCTSLGVLEKRLVAMIRQRTGTTGG